jgi:hypothetical protein
MENKLNLLEAFEIPFRDQDWRSKILIGSTIVVFSFVLPFIGFPILYGWGIHTARDIKNGENASLPEWSRIWAFFIDGLKFSIANLIWMTPFLILSIGFMIFIFSLTPNGAEGDFFQSIFLSLSVIPLLLWSFISPLQFGVAADTNSFIATINPICAFQFVKKAPTHVLISWVIAIALQYLMGQIGMALFCIGYFPAIALQMILWGTVFGQALRNMDTEKLSTLVNLESA